MKELDKIAHVKAFHILKNYVNITTIYLILS